MFTKLQQEIIDYIADHPNTSRIDMCNALNYTGNRERQRAFDELSKLLIMDHVVIAAKTVSGFRYAIRKSDN